MESSLALPPFLIFYVGALIAIFLRGTGQKVTLVAIPLVGFINLLGFADGLHWSVHLFNYDLHLVRIDKLSLLFGYLFHLAALIGIVFALHVRDLTQTVSALIYAGSTLGAVFANDLIGLFLFWEMMAISSVFLIWACGTERAYRAGIRYLIIQVTSGMVLLAGALIRIHETGSIDFNHIGLEGLGGGLILFAFGIKACFPFLHNWMTDAYPEATPTGTVFLSALTTKLAIYALARGFAGTEVLIYVGATMAMFPIFFAVIENDLRRVLAYSLVNQVGYMVVGIGLGTELAVNGAVAHAFAHVIYKGLLFMSMGAVLFRTGEIRGSHLGGLYKSMPWTTTFCVVGAASISAFPLFSGFVAKSMVMASALAQGYEGVWLALLFAAAGVFHHAGIKIPFFAFFAHDSGKRVAEAPPNMLVAMAIASFVCIFIGVYPTALYALLPHEMDFHPYDATHVLAQTQLLFFSALAFVWLKLSGLYPPELRSVNLDAEWFYRRLLPRTVIFIDRALTPVQLAVRRASNQRIRVVIDAVFRHHGPEGAMARTWPIGSTVIWVAVLLVLYLIVYYLEPSAGP